MKKILLKVALEHGQASIFFPDKETSRRISRSCFGIMFDRADRVVTVHARGDGFEVRLNGKNSDPNYPFRAIIEDADGDGFPRFRAMEMLFEEHSKGFWTAICPKFHLLPWPAYKRRGPYDFATEFERDLRIRLASARASNQYIIRPDNDVMLSLPAKLLDLIAEGLTLQKVPA